MMRILPDSMRLPLPRPGHHPPGRDCPDHPHERDDRQGREEPEQTLQSRRLASTRRESAVHSDVERPRGRLSGPTILARPPAVCRLDQIPQQDAQRRVALPVECSQCVVPICIDPPRLDQSNKVLLHNISVDRNPPPLHRGRRRNRLCSCLDSRLGTRSRVGG